MRFSLTTQQAILKLWLDGLSIEKIASCYTTTSGAVEHMIRVQLRTKCKKESSVDSELAAIADGIGE